MSQFFTKSILYVKNKMSTWTPGKVAIWKLTCCISGEEKEKNWSRRSCGLTGEREGRIQRKPGEIVHCTHTHTHTHTLTLLGLEGHTVTMTRRLFSFKILGDKCPPRKSKNSLWVYIIPSPQNFLHFQEIVSENRGF